MPAWVCDRHTGLRHQGRVMNISAGGAYVLACLEKELKVGRAVEITIGTPNDDHGGFELHRCERSARVVRTEQLGYATGLALQFAGQLQRVGQQHQLMSC